MRLTTVSSLSLLSLALPFAANAASHGPPGQRHDAIARRARGDVSLHKRDGPFSNARFTFYDVGLGACGQTNVPSDFIVALNTPQFGGGYPGPHCFKKITIQWGGKQTEATIMDECPGCPYGGLDFSRGLFDFFASEDVGVLYGTWWYNDDGGNGGGNPDPAPPAPSPPPPTTKHTSTPKPTPTPTPPPPPPPPPPTTHHTTSTPPPPPPEPTTTEHSTTPPPPPETTSSSEPPKSSSESSSSETPSSSSSVEPTPTPTLAISLSQVSASASPTSESSSAAASATPSVDAISSANQAMLGIAGLLVAGAANGQQ